MISYRPLPTPADLDLGRAWHGDRTDSRGLSGYVGHSMAWLACEHARRHGCGWHDLSREGALRTTQTRAQAQASFRQRATAERAECEARRTPKPAGWNAWKRGQPRSDAAKRQQAAAMTAYYHQRGLADTPQAAYMREWRKKQKAGGGQA